MNARVVKWTAALAVSGLVHAAAALAVIEKPDTVEIEGGGQVEMAVLGNSFADAVSAGDVSETIEPVEPRAETARSVSQPQVAARAAPETVVPAARETERPQAVAETAQPITPAEASEHAVKAAPETVASIEAAPERLAPAASHELVDVPVPTPRPEYTPPPKTAEPAGRTVRVEPKPQRRAPKTAGSGGRSNADAKAGSGDGAANARATAAGRHRRSEKAGNAEISNYPGKVVARLRRALRYPAGTRQRGEVRVAFTVTGAGSVTGIRVVRSSGSDVLDRAAVDTVRRAAPFPRIPDGAGRTSWPFTVPLSFVR